MAIGTDLYPHIPHITAAPHIRGAAAVVRGTRLPVRAIAFYWRETGDKARIIKSFPQLTPETLDEAIRYYEDHRAAIDEELRAEVEVA
jgi:uncharacterized protein (DUF433 family)